MTNAFRCVKKFASIHIASATMNVDAIQDITQLIIFDVCRDANQPAVIIWLAWRQINVPASLTLKRCKMHHDASPLARSQPTSSSASMRNASHQTLVSVTMAIDVFPTSSVNQSAVTA